MQAYAYPKKCHTPWVQIQDNEKHVRKNQTRKGFGVIEGDQFNFEIHICEKIKKATSVPVLSALIRKVFLFKDAPRLCELIVAFVPIMPAW